MIYLFQLHPDVRLLHWYGYLDLNVEQVEQRVASGDGEELEVQYVFDYKHKTDFEAAFKQLIDNADLQDHHDTLLYIALRGNEVAYDALSYYQETHASSKRAKELAGLLVCLKEIPERELMALKLNALTNSYRLTDSKLIAWIGSLVERGLSEGKFDYSNIGEGGFQLLRGTGNSIEFGQPLNYERLGQVASTTVRSPIKKQKKLTAYFLYKIWQFLDNETTMTTNGKTSYTDAQMKFLYDLAALFGWLDPLSPNRENKDYMYSLMATHIKR